MERNKQLSSFIQPILKVVVVFALAATFFLMVYQYDNKYTFQSPQGEKGVLVLNENSLKENPIIFLVDGWEYYGGQLLTPKDFLDNPPIPNQYIFIGEFGGFEKGV